MHVGHCPVAVLGYRRPSAQPGATTLWLGPVAARTPTVLTQWCLHVHAPRKMHEGMAHGLRLKMSARQRAERGHAMIARAIHNQDVAWPDLHTHDAVKQH